MQLGGHHRSTYESLRQPKPPEPVREPKHLERGTGNNERYTPDTLIDTVREVTPNIDLDPASTPSANETVQAGRIFTKEDDGLEQDWTSESLWLNPPYGRGEIDAFVDKLARELDAGKIGTAMVITHNATETRWAQTLLERSRAICMLDKRVDFKTPGEQGAGTLRGQIIYLVGHHPDVEAFAKAFQSKGEVYVPYR